MHIKTYISITILFLCSSIISAQNQVLLKSIDFEKDTNNPILSVSSVGSFNDSPGFSNKYSIAGNSSFAFGKSKCSVNCGDDYTSSLKISFPKPQWIKGLTFAEMERGSNFGSIGAVFIDGQLIETSLFGRIPLNDTKENSSPRFHGLKLNNKISTIEFRVRDITSKSQIIIDNIQIYKQIPDIAHISEKSTLLASGYIRVVANQKDANVLLNGCYIGKTPVKQKIFVSNSIDLEIEKSGFIREQFSIPVQANLVTEVKVNLIQPLPSYKSYYTLEDFGWEKKTWKDFYVSPSNLKPEVVRKPSGGIILSTIIGVPISYWLQSAIFPDELIGLVQVIHIGAAAGGIVLGIIGFEGTHHKNKEYNNQLKNQNRVIAESKAQDYNLNLKRKLREKNKLIEEENARIMKLRKEIRSENTISYKIGEDGQRIYLNPSHKE